MEVQEATTIVEWQRGIASVNISSWYRYDGTILTVSTMNGSMSHIPPSLMAEAQII